MGSQDGFAWDPRGGSMGDRNPDEWRQCFMAATIMMTADTYGICAERKLRVTQSIAIIMNAELY